MIKEEKMIYQFKVTLEEIEPVIWRRIQVPENYTFWEFHVAIQDAMGWTDSHLHQFIINDKDLGKKIFIGIPVNGECGEVNDTKAGWKIPIKQYFSLRNKTAHYEYDFGDGWMHTIVFEKILPVEKDLRYPRCLDGEMACPPEDCGGISGYYNVLEVISDPKHEDHEDMLEWLGRKYNPTLFKVKLVKFSNPKKRLREMILNEL